mgnify:CR=1 FL=1
MPNVSASRGSKIAAPPGWCSTLTLGLFLAWHSALLAFPSPTSGPVGSESASAGGMCRPPALGNPCAIGGIAGQGNHDPLPSLGIDNPIHLGNGNKYQLDVDLPANIASPGVELVRHYNALSRRAGVVGSNWTWSYDVRLERHTNGWHARQADGSVRRADHITKLREGYLWTWSTGQQLRFDDRGRLTGIRLAPGRWTEIQRHLAPHFAWGEIKKVIAAGGHELTFHYRLAHGQVLVDAVDTPLGRFVYQYEAPPPESGHRHPRLVAEMRPDGMERHYHHEPALQGGNPYAVTGISLRDPPRPLRRLSQWAYDQYGRVIKTRHIGRNIPSLDITYVQTATPTRHGHTRIHSANGHVRDVHFSRDESGAYRLHAPTLQYRRDSDLAEIDGTRLHRGANGQLIRVDISHSGWPGLSLARGNTDYHLAWQSAATGRTVQHADHAGRPTEVQYANGDALQLSYDAQGRPTEIVASKDRAGLRRTTRLHWRGRQLHRIEHPAERESRHLGDLGEVLERKLERPSLFGMPPLKLRERFQYDAYGRLVRHELPEGGALLYTWAALPQRSRHLIQLVWEDAYGARRVIIQAGDMSTPRHPAAGYRYGNGLELLTLAHRGPHVDTLLLTHADTMLWHQTRRYDPAGRVTLDHHAHHGRQDATHFTYDARSRMIGAQVARAADRKSWWFAWHENGRLAALRHDGSTAAQPINFDMAGLPKHVGPLTTTYGPSRRLETVSKKVDDLEPPHPIAEYRHNAYGHRIAKQTAQEAVQFLYSQGRLVAEMRSRLSSGPPDVTHRYLYAGATPVGMIHYPRDGPPQLYAVHADLSGAVRLVTDDHRNIRWAATYSPLGKALKWAGDLDFPLRFPGQYHDKETGWHDNLLRTYVPDTGHFLEPDPLGPLPGSDTYGYAAQQPWRYADPSGLLLFAFDGTRYSEDTRGNVWKLAQAYTGGDAYYHPGPGNSQFLDWDAVVAWRAGQILEHQWQALLSNLANQPRGSTTPIHIIGFSRGAALARHFANRIASHTQEGVFNVQDPQRGPISACVDLRFMGLFDTVTQFGIGGSHNHLYDFGIDPLWSWVSHAVALHEHRWTFPLTSAQEGSENVVEAPFVGAHADIGGGVALLDPAGAHAQGTAETPDGDPTMSPHEDHNELARVALEWMHWQAVAAFADFDALDTPDVDVEKAPLRDMRAPLMRVVQHGDRAVTQPSGAPWLTYQADHTRLGKAQRERVESLIERLLDWRGVSGDVVGHVDMKGYEEWLHDVVGWKPK